MISLAQAELIVLTYVADAFAYYHYHWGEPHIIQDATEHRFDSALSLKNTCTADGQDCPSLPVNLPPPPRVLPPAFRRIVAAAGSGFARCGEKIAISAIEPWARHRPS